MIEKDQLRPDTLVEDCGVFGVYTKSYKASQLVHVGLWALQHRGQDGSGISSTDGRNIYAYKGSGLVAATYMQKHLDGLGGHIAIGHNQYKISHGVEQDTQPVLSSKERVSLACNGTLPVRASLSNFLFSKGIAADKLSDAGLMHAAIEYYVSRGESIEDSAALSFPLFTGAFSTVGLTRNKLFAMRDSFGIRPFSIGELGNGGFVLSSETCGLDSVGADFIRDVEPGELVVIDENGLHSQMLASGNSRLDIFELIYFARPDSLFFGKRVNVIRRAMGMELAREASLKVDVVVPVPSSAFPAALGFAEESDIPYDQGFFKSNYSYRTSSSNLDNQQRKMEILRKLIPLPEVINGKRVAVIDDSIVSGTTLEALVFGIRKAGAREIHLLSASPPIKYPDFYGIAIPEQRKLIAATMSPDEICRRVGADSLTYLSLEGLIRAIGLPESIFCTSCLTGRYPIDIGDFASQINFAA